MSKRKGHLNVSIDATADGLKQPTKQAKKAEPTKQATLTMKAIVREFKKSMLHEELRKKWVSDDAWVQLLTDTYHLDGLTLKVFNRAISRSTEYSMLDSLQSNNSGIRVKRKVRGSKRYFSYVTEPGEVYDDKEMLKGTKAWRNAFDYNRLRQSSRSKAAFPRHLRKVTNKQWCFNLTMMVPFGCPKNSGGS